MQPPVTSKAIATVPLGLHITSLRFSPKSNQLAVAASTLTGNVWSGSFFVLDDKRKLAHRVVVDHGCSALAWSSKSLNVVFVATDDGIISQWQLDEQPRLLQAHDGHNDLVTDIAVDPIGITRVASASYDRTIKIWNTETKPFPAEQTLDGHIDYVTAVDWNPKTTGVLASGGWDSAVCLWDIRTEIKTTQVSCPSKVFALVWASEHTLYYGTEHGALVSLDVRNLSAPTATTQVQGDLPVRALAVNPNDPEQVAAGGENTSVDVYSKSLEKIYGYSGHSDFVQTLDWSRTQPGQLASGGFDKTVHWWSSP